MPNPLNLKLPAGAGSYKPSFWEVLDGVLGGDTISKSRFNAQARAAALANAQKKQALSDRIAKLITGEGDEDMSPDQAAAPLVPPTPKRMGPIMDEGLPQPDAPVAPAVPPVPMPSKRRFNPDRLNQILAAAAYSGDEGAGKAAEVISKLRPDLDKGMYVDSDGTVRLRPGYADASREASGASTGGSEAAKAALDVIAVPMPDGSTFSLPRAAYIALQQSGKVPGLGVSQTPGAKVAAEEAARSPYDFVDATDPQGRPMKVAKSAAAGQTFVGQSPAEALAAKGATEALDRVPGLIDTLDQGMGVINAIKTHPDFKNRVGFGGVLPAFPGTKGVDFDSYVNQLKGKTFLEAFNTLRGGGQITEAEGAKATDALARLNQKQTPEGFTKALNDLYGVFQAGRQRALQQAQGGAQPPTARRAALAAGGYSIVGVRRAGQ